MGVFIFILLVISIFLANFAAANEVDREMDD